MNTPVFRGDYLGIYLVHPIFIDMLHYLFKVKYYHPIYYIPIFSMITFLLSAISVYFLMKIRSVRGIF
ncbi:hypothetical protein EBL_c05030 [Shimwellia blattae DSM 4481 = NBRC 105725]|uniref:Uncharacterized protein n=1 Tax=Shimwellia blattae (strain ATCC 29907 / DSM 4481 / JCM 1650 / NBRC 105725 / CDC 9005-74) TaxID=630626 RepID=I2B525_SHIBC|nr:hypothetical protein EBL_c05030 [Shimwellia blattae DSM 4481 = NBRC 105725]